MATRDRFYGKLRPKYQFEPSAKEIGESVFAAAKTPEVEKVEYLEWGQVQEEILDAVLMDSIDSEDEVWDGEHLKALAKRLRADLDEMMLFRGLTQDEIWTQKRFERLLELERLAKRGFSWDRLENAALQKLMILVMDGKITKNQELLAVARVANMATRRPLEPGQSTGGNTGGVNVQVNMFGQAIEGPGLPGPGSLGTIKLNLSQRTVEQLSQGKTIEGESLRLSESAEMLGTDDIKELSKLADEA